MKCAKCGREFEGKFCPWCGEPAGTATGVGAVPAGAPVQPCGQAQYGGAPPYEQPPYMQPAPPAQTAAEQTPPQWEYGQPREKSANALGLQWGRVALYLLLVVNAFVFFFVNVFDYSLAGLSVEAHSVCGLSGMFGYTDAGIAEASVFAAYTGYIIPIGILYGLNFVLGALCVLACLFGVGNYHRETRKSVLINVSVQAGFSLVAMVLYIVFSGAFFADMGVALGGLSPLPYVCFAVNVLLLCFAAALFCVKNTDAHAYLTVWHTSGIAAFCRRHKKGWLFVCGLIVAALVLVLFLCDPIYTDGTAAYNLPQIFNAEAVWDSEGAMEEGRTRCVILFVLLAVLSAAAILLLVWWGRLPEKDAGPDSGKGAEKERAVTLEKKKENGLTVFYAVIHFMVVGAVMLSAMYIPTGLNGNSLPFVAFGLIGMLGILYFAALQAIWFTGKPISPEEEAAKRRRIAQERKAKRAGKK